MADKQLDAAALRQRLFDQIDLLSKQEFSVPVANAIAILAGAINKSWEMQIALETLRRSPKVKQALDSKKESA